MSKRFNRPTPFRLLAAVLAVLSCTSAARASEFTDDLKARRARLMEKLGPDALLVLWSAPNQRYSLDIDYEYRQDSNLFYLTGMTQDDTVLVLMPGNATHKEMLFTKPRNPTQEHWRGRTLSREEATSQTGMDTVLSSTEFESFVAAMMGRRPFGAVDEKEAAKFFEALAAGRARVALPLDSPVPLNAPLTPPLEFARRLRERFTGYALVDLTPTLNELRTVKTSWERKSLIKSLEISSEAQIAGMRAAHPGAYEYEVKAAIEAVHRGRGAVSWSYPSIVGSGPNATILHYAGGERQMQAGELLLVDAACNYQYMSGDITRTYPVSGTFTQPQRDLYQLVLDAQIEGMKFAKAGVTPLDIQKKMADVVKAGLVKLGLVTDATGDQFRTWFTHGTVHYIGLDVHDVGDRNRPLEPGMAFVMEPGVYIRQSALDALPKTPENLAFIEKVRPVVKKYLDIGVRVEDSFLFEESGLRRLSATVPRTIEEIERFMAAKPAAVSQAR